MSWGNANGTNNKCRQKIKRRNNYIVNKYDLYCMSIKLNMKYTNQSKLSEVAILPSTSTVKLNMKFWIHYCTSPLAVKQLLG